METRDTIFPRSLSAQMITVRDIGSNRFCVRQTRSRRRYTTLLSDVGFCIVFVIIIRGGGNPQMQTHKAIFREQGSGIWMCVAGKALESSAQFHFPRKKIFFFSMTEIEILLRTGKSLFLPSSSFASILFQRSYVHRAFLLLPRLPRKA